MAVVAPNPSRDRHEAGTADVRRPNFFPLADFAPGNAVGGGLVRMWLRDLNSATSCLTVT
jgi:hypothetical protein